ncbi:MAG: PRC-barrel domain-containing protein [Pseudomonadota bacterium]|nr:PRC-barrel domain-containing protein [Pseudomonadota bacterium]
MKTSKLLLASAVALTLSGGAWAAEEQAMEKEGMEKEAMQAADSSAYQFRASDIIGREVENAQDEDIGEVDDLIITGQDKVVHAVVSVGGFLGMGEKLVTVPYDELQVNVDDDTVMYNATKEELEAKPEFKYREGETRWRDVAPEERYPRWSAMQEKEIEAHRDQEGMKELPETEEKAMEGQQKQAQ